MTLILKNSSRALGTSRILLERLVGQESRRRREIIGLALKYLGKPGQQEPWPAGWARRGRAPPHAGSCYLTPAPCCPLSMCTQVGQDGSFSREVKDSGFYINLIILSVGDYSKMFNSTVWAK